MPSCWSELSLEDLINWTVPSGVSRWLFVYDRPGSSKCVVGFARAWITLLILLPLALGLAEIALGAMNSHMRAECKAPLHIWLIVDGCLALVTVTLCLIDFIRVQSDQQELFRRGDLHSKQARKNSLQPYACIGIATIVVLPLLRLFWLIWAADMVLQMDPFSMKLFAFQTSYRGPCSPLLFNFIYFYLGFVTVLLIAVLALVLLLFSALVVLKILETCCWSCCAGRGLLLEERRAGGCCGKGKGSAGGYELTYAEESCCGKCAMILCCCCSRRKRDNEIQRSYSNLATRSGESAVSLSLSIRPGINVLKDDSTEPLLESGLSHGGYCICQDGGQSGHHTDFCSSMGGGAAAGGKSSNNRSRKR